MTTTTPSAAPAAVTVHWAVHNPDGEVDALTTNYATASWLVDHRQATTSALPWREWRIEPIAPIVYAPEDGALILQAPTGGRYVC